MSLYLSKQTSLSNLAYTYYCIPGPTSLTIKVGGEEVRKIIPAQTPPMERTISEESDLSSWLVHYYAS